ncbi:MAG: protein kinase, partial [Candidatus Heimdallarchaeota archaeon]|nr:protein kinase [Candidatus Heimdallarchaeota archaeon]
MSDTDNNKTLHLKEKKKSPVAQLPAGTMLHDRYKILNVAGVGGMGTVYRAQDTNFQANRMVAVKEMISQINDPAVQKNIFNIYERESNILASLRHQAIPRIYDYFILNNRAYLVMEFINGQNLGFILNETKSFLPETQIVTWALELCNVLEYLHSNKPEPVI